MKIAVNPEVKWEYVKPAPLNTKMLLLTKDNQCVVGPWKGEPLPGNKTYKGWCGLPDRDQQLETALGYR